MTLSLLPDERKIRADVDRSNPKVYFVNECGIYMSVFREVIYGLKVIDLPNGMYSYVSLRRSKKGQKKVKLVYYLPSDTVVASLSVSFIDHSKKRWRHVATFYHAASWSDIV
jgi:hypothetical protein